MNASDPDSNYSSNRLGLSSSRYLLQHRDDPVHWQPWSEDVLEHADLQGKPILLSIGYSACHWCHVMARESFLDPDVARLLNEHFVCIKVDREERPDLDHIYQTAHQLLTGRAGGWPLNCFLCPRSRLPFLVGTYFPRHGVEGHPGFADLLLRVRDYYRNRGPEFGQTLEQVQRSYELLSDAQATVDVEASLSNIPLERAARDLLKLADSRNGGFGAAPKFPMPAYLERLLLVASSAGKWQDAARQHLQRSLQTMAVSGINDQVSGGFFRYATDEQWTIPHFEKMLYDNALLLAVYAQSWQLLGDDDMQAAAHGIARWALEDMRHEGGAFYTSLDADASGEEGGCYVCEMQDMLALLDEREMAVFAAVYGLDRAPNFDGRWHLCRSQQWRKSLEALALEESEQRALLTTATAKLRQARLVRPRPERDEKILTAWNALMVRGLAMAARVFGDREYLLAAQQAVDFIRDKLWHRQRLHAVFYTRRQQAGEAEQGNAKLRGYLDDYVFLMDALLELLQTEWRDEDYRFLGLLAEAVCNNFEDEEQGGFYFTAHDSQALIFRNKPYLDGVMPSGNGVAAKVFGRLGHLCGEPRYLGISRRVLLNGWASMLRQPAEHHSLMHALEEYLAAPPQVLIKGGAELDDWRQAIQQQHGQRVLCYRIPISSAVHPPELFALDEGQAVLCVGDSCFAPQDHLPALSAQLATALEAITASTEEFT